MVKAKNNKKTATSSKKTTKSKVIKKTPSKTEDKSKKKIKLNKKVVIQLLVPTIFLLILVIGATYAYYNVQYGNNSSTHSLLTHVDKAGSVSLVNPTKNLHIRMTALNMKKNNGVYELWATNTSENYDEVEIPREIAKATVIGGEDDTKYTCHFTLDISLSGDMEDALTSGDAIIKFSGIDTFEYDLSDFESPRTIVIENLSGKNREEILYVSAKINNKNSNQDYLQGKELDIDIDTYDFSCELQAAIDDDVYAVNFYPNRLPDQYQEVDYIENDGSQYIDTGVTPSNTLRTDITWTDTSASGSNYVLGARAGASSTILYSVSGARSNLAINTSFNGNAKELTHPRVEGNRYNVVLDIEANNNQYRSHAILKDLTNGSSYEQYGDYVNGLSGTLPNIMVFALRTGQISEGMQLHSLRMWNNGVLIRDFVPCYRISDDKPGLYDLVNDVFYTNASNSATDFDIGPDTYYDQLIPVDEETYLYKNTYTKYGYSFLEWNTEPDGSGDTYYDRDEVIDLVNGGETIDLYAIWTTKILAVFDPGGGTATMANKAVSTGNTYGPLPTASKAGYTFKGWTRLPSGYVEVQYIESTGSQYAITDIVPNDQTGIYIKLRSTNVTNDKIYFGSGNSSNNRYWIGSISGHFYYGWNTYVANNGATAKANTTYELKLNYMNDRKFKVGNANYTPISETLTTKTDPITIFGYMNGTSNNLNPTARIYSFKVTQGSEIIADLVPCIRTEDNKPGFYDIINNKFYSNRSNSETDFTAGSRVYVTSSTVVKEEETHTLSAVWDINSYIITIKGGYGIDEITYDNTTASSMTRTLKYNSTLDLSSLTATHTGDFSGMKLSVVNGPGTLEGTTFTVGDGTATILVDPTYPKKCYTSTYAYNGATPSTGLEFVEGKFTYKYKYKRGSSSWTSITDAGWGVMLTDATSTAAVTDTVCAYINDKPLVNLSYMFSNSKATRIDVSSYYTKNVNQTLYTFRNIEASEIIGLSNWNTSSITNMASMFYNLKNITVLDLTGWNTALCTNMNNMFRGSTKLTTIYASTSFVTTQITNNGKTLFTGCTALVGGNDTRYSQSNVDKDYAWIDGRDDLDGYFTEGPPPSN